MGAVYIYEAPGGHFFGQRVKLSEPKSVALLARAQRTLSQATKPYTDKLTALLAKEQDSGTSTAIAESIAAVEVKRDESPAVIAARADVARLSALATDELSKQRPVIFVPLAADGTRVEWNRTTVSTDTFEAWRAESDDAARRVILTTNAISTKTGGKSSPAITAAMQSALVPGTYSTLATMQASLAAGILAMPTERGDKSAATKRVKRTTAEKHEDALAFLFESVEATDETATDEPTSA